jgi:uncharacterized protein (DUF1330 family)
MSSLCRQNLKAQGNAALPLAALDGAAPKRFVMVAFDSMEKASGFYQNTKEMTAMRIKATKSRAFIVEGL